MKDSFSLLGIWVIVTLLPTLYLNMKQVDKPLTKIDYAGWAVWLFGFLFESIADHQKMTFKNNPINKVNQSNLVSIDHSRLFSYRTDLLIQVFGNIPDIRIISAKSACGSVCTSPLRTC